MMLLILAGNTAFVRPSPLLFRSPSPLRTADASPLLASRQPVFLRFTIWALSMLCPATSRLHETCRFLLDHPRRCYLYLFPAHQTVFLLTVIFFMTCVPISLSPPLPARATDSQLAPPLLQDGRLGLVPRARHRHPVRLSSSLGVVVRLR